MFPFLMMPQEIQIYTILFMTTDEILLMRKICKKLYRLLDNNLIWKKLSGLRWNTFAPLEIVNWKNYFHQRLLLNRTKLKCKLNCGLGNQPSPRQSLTGTYVDGKIVYIGGQTSTTVRYNDIYYLNPKTKRFTKPSIKGVPPKFARHAATAIGSKIYIFGGYDGFKTFIELAIYDVEISTWMTPQVNGEKPVPRTNHKIVSHGTKVYLFGGNNTNLVVDDVIDQSYNDFHVLDTETLVWTRLDPKGTGPCKRSGHQMVSIGNKIYIYGGGIWDDVKRIWLERYNDMYVYDIKMNSWVSSSPTPCSFISLLNWTFENFFFVYSDDIWYFDTISNEWNQIKCDNQNKPKKRFLGSAIMVPGIKSSVFFFGGIYDVILGSLDRLTFEK